MLLVLAAFLAGGALGMYGDRAMVQRRIRAYGETPADLPRHLTERMAKELSLTDEQSAAVLGVMQEFDAQFKTMRAEHRARVDVAREGLNARLDGILTPDQAAKHHAKMAELEARHQERMQLRRAMK
jgi:Spy/CpxP family protein refolding chaperone